jgi:hypothetical protein
MSATPRKKPDMLMIWFFIVLAALIPATGLLIWVVTNDIHI